MVTKIFIKIDTLSLTFAGIAFVFWLLADQPLIAAILISLIDAIGGFFPTLENHINYPYEETLTSYVAYSISTILALTALDNHSIELMLYPIAVIVLNMSFVVYVLVRRSIMHKKK
jgi:Na+-transporting methylmalonyl-CoA/oxaloacetate decarboxylase gamma subunit